MSYAALYRKFRPQTFSEVKGQDHVVRTIKNQIKNGKAGHAYLFTGTRGTGKTSVAKIMAKALNCLDPKDGEPCNCCENCLAINSAAFMDVLEMDAASNNGVDDIRRLTEEIMYTPAKGRYKVFIIDEAHMITKAAFNAFLKTLEEPPEYAVFILATTEPHKLPQTILSRVQRYDFRRIPTDVIKENLKELAAKEGCSARDKALDYIARLGDGSMRDAVSFLDKCIAYSLGKELTYDIVLEALGAADTESFSGLLRAVYAGDCAGALEFVDQASAQGKDISRFVTDFCGYLRNVLLTGINPGAAEKITGVSAENMALLKKDAARVRPEIIIRYINNLSELLNRMRFSSVRQLLAEVEFIRLSRPQMETDNSAVLDRIRQLESRPAAVVNETEDAASLTPPIRTAYEAPPISGEAYAQAGPLSSGVTSAQTEPSASGEAYAQAPPAASAGAGQAPLIAGAISGEAPARIEPSASGEAKVSWDEVVSALGTGRLKTTLKKAKAREEDGVLCIWVEGMIAQKTAEDGTDEIKRILNEKGFDMEVIIKEGMPEEPEDTDGISEAELFKNINFDIGTEEF